MNRALVISAFLATGLLALLGGCGQGTPSFEDSVAAQEAERAAQLDILCDCYAELPGAYPDKASCVAALTMSANAEVEACRVAAYDLAPESSRDHVDCELEVTSQMTACLEASYTCADLGSLFDCDAERVAALDACPPLATVVIDAQIACAP